MKPRSEPAARNTHFLADIWRGAAPRVPGIAGLLVIAFLAGIAGLLPVDAAPLHPTHFKPHPSDKIFESPIQRFEITLAPPELDSLRREPRKTVPATLRVGSNTWQRVGVRVKGAAGSTRGIDDNPALTLNADKFVPGQKVLGLDKFHLNNSVQDASRMSELVCGDLYRRAGIPATRATHALFTLNGRDLGLYVLKEGFDHAFLARNFTDASGNLYDGGFLRDVDQDLELDSGKEPPDWKDLHALANACRMPTPDQRNAQLDALLDVNRFLTYAALQVMTEDWDGYPGNRNNYRLYHDPASGKFVFMPHGMDQMFRQGGMPVDRRFEGMVAQAVMGRPEWREAYYARVADLLTHVFTPDAIFRTFDAAVARREPALAKLSPGDAEGIRGDTRELRRSIAQRIPQVAAMLANRPKPVRLGTDGALAPGQWMPRVGEDGGSAERVQDAGQPVALRLSLAGPGIPSWRARVDLSPGKYRLEARARTRDVESAGDAKGTGLGIRISGAPRANKVVGTTDWTPLTFDFVLEGAAEVELVAELRGQKGTGVFDATAFKLRRIP